MTPAAQYAQKREEAVELIRQHAPERVQDALIDLLRPAIALSATRADDAQIPLGASKFGGAPDVPAGFEWPMWNDKPLGFLAQINLEEVVPFDIENLLPKSGLLSFFYDFDEWPYGEIEDKGGWRVLHLPSVSTRADVPEDSAGEDPIATALISFGVICDVPVILVLSHDNWATDWSQEEKEAWREFLKVLPERSHHLMLGFPTPIQGDARDEVAQTLKRGERDDWLLLLQMDSDDEIDFSWGDAGAMFYLIHHNDLEKRDFEQTWLIGQCF